MSLLGQLKSTYTSVLNATLQHCDDGELDLSVATMEDLKGRWYNLLERRLLEMQEKANLDPPVPLEWKAPDPEQVMSTTHIPMADTGAKGFNVLSFCEMLLPMEDLTEAQQSFPALPPKPLSDQGSKALTDLAPIGSNPGDAVPSRPKRKRAGTATPATPATNPGTPAPTTATPMTPATSAAPMSPLPPPLAVLNAIQSTSKEDEEDEQELADCFEGAEVIVASASSQVNMVPQIEDAASGSELGSDLDDPEEVGTPDASILTKVARIKKAGTRWTLRLKQGILKTGAVEILFATGNVQMKLPEAPMHLLEAEHASAIDQGILEVAGSETKRCKVHEKRVVRHISLWKLAQANRKSNMAWRFMQMVLCSYDILLNYDGIDELIFLTGS
eukprot:symbB.v1.2.028876.t1/scaffold3104.1/size63510/2